MYAFKMYLQQCTRWCYAITPTAPRQSIPNTPLTPVVAPRHSPRTTTPANATTIATRIPWVRFVPINGGIQNRNFISQEAIDFLTECIWANSPNVFTPSKLRSNSAPSCLDFTQVAMPMVHPTTGETISSYK